MWNMVVFGIDGRELLQASLLRIAGAYEALSSKYHTEKGNNHRNSLTFG